MHVQGNTVYMACVYPGYEDSEMRCKMRLRTRTPGHNNRLDISDLFTYDRTDGTRATLDSVLPLLPVPTFVCCFQSRAGASSRHGRAVFYGAVCMVMTVPRHVLVHELATFQSA